MANVQKTPKHLWIIGITGLIWNLMAAFDYLMAKFQVAAYIEMWSAAEQTFFTSFPLWVNASWAIAVWGAGVYICDRDFRFAVAALCKANAGRRGFALITRRHPGNFAWGTWA
jgi:hypothetical protein